MGDVCSISDLLNQNSSQRVREIIFSSLPQMLLVQLRVNFDDVQSIKEVVVWCFALYIWVYTFSTLQNLKIFTGDEKKIGKK